MRRVPSIVEIRFRLGQEAANAWFLVRGPRPPQHTLDQIRSPLSLLPDPASVLQQLAGTVYAGQVSETADDLLRHTMPLLGLTIETGPDIRWRRDYVHGIETGTDYFRRIPYLNFAAAGDHKIVWELNRHQHLVLLAQAWRMTGRGEYRDEVFRQLRSWLDQNPFQRGINWCSALEVAFRALSWIWIWHLTGPAEMGPELTRDFLTGLYQHGLHLDANLSVYFSPNTHLLGEALALHAIGKLVPEFGPSASWVEKGSRIVREEIRRQVHDDHSYFEQSTYYHVYATDMFLFHAILDPRAAQDAEYMRRLRGMVDYLDQILGLRRAIPLMGDDDGGRFFHPWGARDTFGRGTLAAASVFFSERAEQGCVWSHEAEDLLPIAVWWFGGKASSKRPVSAGAPAGSVVFEDAGLVILRHGDVELFFDAGPFGPGTAGHSHSDTLSVVLRCGDEETLIDSGTYTYISDPEWRDRFRGSAAHNTLRIDGRNQALPLGPFAWSDKPKAELLGWSSTEVLDEVAAACSWGPYRHVRRIRFDKTEQTISITDEVAGASGQPVLIEQFWHSGELIAPLSERSAQIGTRAILTLAEAPVSIEQGGEFGWRSRALGEKQPASCVTIQHRSAQLPWSLTTQIGLRSQK